ncbi:MAG: hypothetical protein F6K39_16285 [Okeania sp. SIO3B3]|nr:hypothetical protein [Okeania sp. SIO3B3]
MVEGRQWELKAGGRRFSQECHLNFIHAPMLPDMISGVGANGRSPLQEGRKRGKNKEEEEKIFSSLIIRT